MFRRRRTAAVVDLRAPSLAVWPGEVVLVAAPDEDELCRLLAAVRTRTAPPGGVTEAARGYHAANDIEPLADSAAQGGAVVAGVRLCPGGPARRTLAFLRACIARRVPCRCVWLVGGRVYPE